MVDQNPAYRQFTYDEAQQFLAPYKLDVLEAASIEEIDKQAEAFFDGFLPISYEWIKSALPGISQKGKSLVRQYWERCQERSVDERNICEQQKQDAILTAELLSQSDENERQALYGIMGALANLRTMGGSLVKLAPDLFKDKT